ncbi:MULTISPECIES: FecR domain-containing protein [unclassified Pseudomonas]|uniref:FecR domain-containing protein n=1 Tax=unclassified Pseudomonas TaxID=196821 RepID=UPI00244D6A3F|nr:MULTISPECIES: FecR domain-containing protein [unclassified Pseudomonas]MDG9929373.1 FecR domain-containing protein [Pseudomonas sp. GD04042]MDH0481651.1 FecR domain-containing protein [Pseudomonas sp. GD04015]MDH0603023.1 FecR domain-containing protein [Pseudomonas sp. GD03869]
MSRLDAAVVEQAIAWRVRLASGTCADEEISACLDWRRRHTDHELAWQRLDGLGERFARLPTALGHAALDEPGHDPLRRRALKALGLLIAVGGAGALAVRGEVVQPLFANLRTGTGERRSLLLPDGGRLHLNAGSAVDIDYGPAHRLIRLYQGEILLETAADERQRPFLVDTRQGTLRALGTRFRVHDQGASCQVAVYAGAVEVIPRQGVARVLQAGTQARFDPSAVQAGERADEDRSRWVDGVLVAREMRLDAVVAELERQRPGVLRCDPAVAGLRISGVFPLDDTDRALTAIGQTLPVRVVYRTRYWVSLMAV